MCYPDKFTEIMLVNHFGELSFGGRSLAILLSESEEVVAA